MYFSIADPLQIVQQGRIGAGPSVARERAAFIPSMPLRTPAGHGI